MDIQEKEWGSFVEHLKTKGVVKIGRNALGVITNLVREGSCSLGYNNIELMWETRQAAKTQAVPEPSINMTGHDLKYIWDFMDYADPENLDTEVTIQLCKEGFDGAGLYAWVAEYPEEGGIKLGEAQEPAND